MERGLERTETPELGTNELRRLDETPRAERRYWSLHADTAQIGGPIPVRSDCAASLDSGTAEGSAEGGVVGEVSEVSDPAICSFQPLKRLHTRRLTHPYNCSQGTRARVEAKRG
jgi:hypothetical protein